MSHPRRGATPAVTIRGAPGPGIEELQPGTWGRVFPTGGRGQCLGRKWAVLGGREGAAPAAGPVVHQDGYFPHLHRCVSLPDPSPPTPPPSRPIPTSPFSAGRSFLSCPVTAGQQGVEQPCTMQAPAACTCGCPKQGSEATSISAPIKAAVLVSWGRGAHSHLLGLALCTGVAIRSSASLDLAAGALSCSQRHVG